MRCARDVTGVNNSGIGRRPAWQQKRSEEIITLNLYRAREHLRKEVALKPRTECGDGYHMKLSTLPTVLLWKPAAVSDIHDALQCRRPAKRNPHHEQCFFGHHVGDRMRRQNLVPMWRGADNGACLCIACYATLQREMNDPQQELVLAAIPPVNKKHKSK